MFEAQVAYYLNLYLGKYLSGLDAESLKISVWRGDVQLSNLALKPEALQDLELPITVKSGLLGKLTLKVPWNKLGQEPVIVEFDRLYILAGPKAETDQPATSQDVEAYEASVDKLELEAKRKRVADAEARWLQERDAKADPKASSASPAAPTGGGWMSLVERILGNLQLRMSNVHIRYEDASLADGCEGAGSAAAGVAPSCVAVGVMLQEVVAHTVDEAGRQAFVTQHVLQCLRKAVTLSSLCAYFDVGAAPLQLPRPCTWLQLTLPEWDRLLLPENHHNQSMYGHDFLLCPVSGDMKYNRRSGRFRMTDSEPMQGMELTLQEVQVQYSRQQYARTQQLLQVVELYQANAPYRHMRPAGRPAAGRAARVWWRYALRCVRQRHALRRDTWTEVQKVARLRRKYVPQYERCLREGLAGDEVIAALDAQLPEGAILQFRRLAHASVEASRRQALQALEEMSGPVAPRTTAAAQRKQRQGQRTWGEWMWGSAPAAGGQAPGGSSSRGSGGGGGRPAGEEGGMRGELSVQEWQRLQELITESSEQEEDAGGGSGRGGAAAAGESPRSVRMALDVRMARASARLVEASAGGAEVEVCCASMSLMQLKVLKYPATLAVSVAVGQAQVTSDRGPLFSTALGTTERERQGGRAASAFVLDFVSKPQDEAADATLELRIAPSFITYSPQAVAGVLAFFSSGAHGLQLTTLQARAAARTEQLRRMAQLQLRTLSAAEEKLSLKLSLCCHAPKVAILDSTGTCTLLLDLGLFTLTSMRPADAGLRAEEAALYQCFALRVDSVSAHLYDGARFAWSPELGRRSSRSGAAAEGPAPAAPPPPPAPWDLFSMLEESLSSGHSGGGQVVPLLERFSVDVQLHAATSVHPRLPQARVKLATSPLQLHLSPARYHRIMSVVDAVVPSEGEGGPGGARRMAELPVWVSDAECRMRGQVLAWEGLAGQIATWHPRVLTMCRGTLYVSSGKEEGLAAGAEGAEAEEAAAAAAAAVSKTFWRGDTRVVQLAPGLVGGVEHCLALVPAGVKLSAAAECPDSLVVRLPDAAALTELRRHLLRSRTTMEAVAGLLDDGGGGGVDDTGAAAPAAAAQDVLGEMLKHRDVVEVVATVAEVSVTLSGRPPQAPWWPSEALAMEAAAAAAGGDGGGTTTPRAIELAVQEEDEVAPLAGDRGGAASLAGCLALEDESPLVVARFQAARVQVWYSADRLHVSAAMRSLAVDDLLVGSRERSQRVLARSWAVDGAEGEAEAEVETGEERGEDEFEDAMSDGEAESGSEDPRQQQLLVRASYTQYSTDSGQYKGLDSELVLRLSTLYMYCHRPTLAALMSLGADMAAVGTLLAAQKQQRQQQQQLQQEQQQQQEQEQQQQAEAARPSLALARSSTVTAGGLTSGFESQAAVPPSAPAGPAGLTRASSEQQVLRQGGPDRTLLRMRVELQQLQLMLCYEGSGQASQGGAGGSGQPPQHLAEASVARLRLQLDVTPSSLKLAASLGDVHAQYSALAAEAAAAAAAGPAEPAPAATPLAPPPYSTICALRAGSRGSLIELTFTVHGKQEARDPSAPVPPGLAYYSLSARLSAVRLVFLQRFIDEVMQYLTAMLSMALPPLQLPPWAEEYAREQQEAKEAAPQASASDPPPDRPSYVTSSGLVIGPGGEACTLLLLDVDLSAPLIVVPEHSQSLACLEVDLGSARLRNRISWISQQQPAGAAAAQAPAAGAAPAAFRVLMDDLDVTLSNIGAVLVTPSGQHGAQLLHHAAEGFELSLGRPLVQVEVGDLSAALGGTSRPAAPPLPPLKVCISIPEVQARVKDSEYRLLLRLSASNLAERALLSAPGLAALNRRLQAIGAARAVAVAEAQQRQQQSVRSRQVAAASRSRQAASPSPLQRALLGRSLSLSPGGLGLGTPGAGGQSLFNSLLLGSPPQPGLGSPDTSSPSQQQQQQPPPPPPAVIPAPPHDFTMDTPTVLALLSDRCSLSVSISVRQAQLGLVLDAVLEAGQPVEQPLTSISLSDMWVTYEATALGNMFVAINLPTVSIKDLRPGLPREQELVLSTAAVGEGGGAAAAAAAGTAAPAPAPTLTPSLLTFEFRSVGCAAPGSRAAATGWAPLSALRMRVQRPTLVLDFPFIIAALNFAAPFPVLQGALPQPYSTRQLRLGAQRHVAKADLWLSPEFRILADLPGVSTFVYDGGGHRIILPPGLHPTESLPLILVGAARTLRLVNVTLVNSSSLAACLQLGPGACMTAAEEDGVGMVPDLAAAAGPRALSSLPTAGAGVGERERAVQSCRWEDGGRGAGAEVGRGGEEARRPQRFEIHVDAVGANLHLVDSLAWDLTSGGKAAMRRVASQGAVRLPAVSSRSSVGAAGSERARGPSLLDVRVAGVGAAPRGAGAEAAAGGAAATGAAAAGVLRRLTLVMDISTSYRIQGPKQSARVEISGLAMKTLTSLIDPAPPGPSPSPSPKAPPSHHSRSNSTVPSRRPSTSTLSDLSHPTSPFTLPTKPPPSPTLEPLALALLTSPALISPLLEPCDITLTYTDEPDLLDAVLDVPSRLMFNLAPDQLQLLLQLQGAILQPLIVPPPDRPLRYCERCTCVWAFGCAAAAAAAAAAGGAEAPEGGGAEADEVLDVAAAMRGVSFWSPDTPSGYVKLGDVLCTSGEQPTQQVAVAAVNSGLVAFPLSFDLVWEEPRGQAALWRPVPPPGYVALGCVATCGLPGAGAPVPPGLRSVGCIHAGAAVDASLGHCLALPAAGAAAGAVPEARSVWTVQNLACGFEAAAPGEVRPAGPLFDLRSPLGVPPVALTPEATLLAAAAGSGPKPQLSQAAQKLFLEQRKKHISVAAMQRNVATAVEFTRIWWDKHSAHPSLSGVTFWRPVPPPGYVSLGDCMVTGVYAPPQGVLVLRDVDPALTFAAGRQAPLLAAPTAFSLVWADSHRARMGDPRFLTIWRPVAPDKYTGLGMVASTGPHPPPLSVMRCVRSDACFTRTLSRSSPNWIQPELRTRMAVYGWTTDDRNSSFLVMSQVDMDLGSPLEVQCVRLNEDGDDTEGVAPAAGGAEAEAAAHAPAERSLGVTATLSKGAALVLRNTLRQPIAELGAREVTLGLPPQVPGVSRGFMYVTASVNTYNAHLSAWEPLLEPWKLLLHLDKNPHSKLCGGVDPGTALRLTSTDGTVNVSLAQAAITNVLANMPEWNMAVDGGERAVKELLTNQLSAAEGSNVQSAVTNGLGMNCQMLINMDNSQELVEIPKDEVALVTLPLQQPPPNPLSRDSATWEAGTAAAAKASRSTSGAAPPLSPAWEEGEEADGPVSLRPWLLVDVLGCTAVQGAAAPGAEGQEQGLEGGQELRCSLAVRGRLAAFMPESSWGLITRAVLLPKAAPAPGAGVPAGDREVTVEWRERFLLRLPRVLCEALVARRADPQFLGAPVELEFTVLAAGGPGREAVRRLGSALLSVEYNWMVNQVDLMRTPSTGRSTTGATAAGAVPSPSGLVHVQSLGATAAAAVPQPQLRANRSAGDGRLGSAELAPSLSAAAAGPIAAAAASAAAPAPPDPPGPGASFEDHCLQGIVAELKLQPGQDAPASPTWVKTLSVGVSFDISQVEPSWLKKPRRGQQSAAAHQALSRRAVRLLKQDAATGRESRTHWVPFHPSNLQLTGGGADKGAGGLVPIPVGPGIVLEASSVPGGARQELLRSLFQLLNDCNTALEVSLVVRPARARALEDQWTLVGVGGGGGEGGGGVPASASAPQISFQQDPAAVVVEEEVFENERLDPGKRQWGPPPPAAQPGERQRFNRARGSAEQGSLAFPLVPLPAGWEWERAWQVAPVPGAGDPDGWAYGTDWEDVRYPFPAQAGARTAAAAAAAGSGGAVRRRRWVRVRRQTKEGLAAEAEAEAARTLDPQAAWRRVIRVVPPGEKLPLPLYCCEEGCDLQVRPAPEPSQNLGEEPDVTSGSVTSSSRSGFFWSQSAVQLASGLSVPMSDLREGDAKLLCCRSLAAPPEPPSPGGPPAPPPPPPSDFWLSVVSECDQLVSSQASLDSMTDWRLVVRPPLVLHNLLPVGATFRIWQRARGGNGLQVRGRGSVRAGSSFHVYCVDMRAAVFLEWSPEGCEFAEAGPVLLTLGRGGEAGPAAAQLPDGFCCRYRRSIAAGMVQVRINLHRSREGAASALVESPAPSSSASYSGAGASDLAPDPTLGLPLHIRLSVPLWILNCTGLPISAGLVPLLTEEADHVLDKGFFEPLDSASSRSVSVMARPVNGGDDEQAGGTGELRLIDTEGPSAASSSKAPLGNITIPPGTVEILSFAPPSSGYSTAAATSLGLALEEQGVVLRLMGSRWTAPLVVPVLTVAAAAAAQGKPGGAADASAPTSYEPVVVRARSRTTGTIFEVVASFTTLRAVAGGGGAVAAAAAAAAASGRSLVLRLDPHMTVSNRTGYSLHLIQPLDPMTQQQAMQQAMQRAATAVQAAAPGGLSVLGPAAGVPASAVLAAPSSAASWAGPATQANAPLRGLDPGPPGAAARATAADRPRSAESLALGPGAVGVPLHWGHNMLRRVLALSLPSAEDVGLPGAGGRHGVHAGGGGGGGWLLWSEPFRMEYPGGVDMQVAVPLYCLGEAGQYSGKQSMWVRSLHGAGGEGRAEDAVDKRLNEAVEGAWALLAEVAVGGGRASDAGGGGGGVRASSCTSPSLVRVSKQTDAGPLAFLAVLVQVSIQLSAPGCLHLVLGTLGAESQRLLYNATKHSLRFREAGAPRAVWIPLLPLSSVPFVRQHLETSAPAEVEIMDKPSTTGASAPEPARLSFDRLTEEQQEQQQQQQQDQAPAPVAHQRAVLKVGHMVRSECLVFLVDSEQVIMTAAGLGTLAGPGSSAAAAAPTPGRTERCLKVVPRPASGAGRGAAEAALAVPPVLVGSHRGAADSFRIKVEVSGSLEVSLVDGRPRELLLVSMDGVTVEYHQGISGGIQYVQLNAAVRNMQVDDQLPGTPHPVMVLSMDSGAARSSRSSSEPLLYLALVSEPGRRRGALYCPCIVARVLPLRVAVSEALVWRLVALTAALAAAAAAGDAGSASAAPGPPRGRSLPLQMDLLNIEGVELSLSFKTDVSSRPRHVSELQNLGLEFANLEDLSLTLPGLERERVKMPRAMILQLVQEGLRQRMLGIAISMLQNYGFLGSTSKLFAAASHGVASLSGGAGGKGGGGPGQDVSNIGEGVLEGGKALARNLVQGAVGIVSQPVQGAEKGGLKGFFGGMARGLVGAAAAPLTGALSAFSKVTEGLDGTYQGVKNSIKLSGNRRPMRRRLPRPFTGDRVLRPFHLDAALGQALLHETSIDHMPALGAPGRKPQGGSSFPFRQEACEQHFVLSSSQVLLVTSRRVLLLEAPEFVALETRLMRGEQGVVTEVPGGHFCWQLPWEGLLAAELRWSQQTPGQAEGIVLHRKRRGGPEDSLLHDLRWQRSTQAQEVLDAIQSCRHRYYIAPRSEAASWRELRDPCGAGRAGDGQQRPDTLLSVEFRPVWYRLAAAAQPTLRLGGGPGASSRAVSIWRPLGPPGYASLGDVAVLGTDAPPHPVRLYKDYGMGGDGDAPGEGPRLSPPVGYSLVFRDSSNPPVTIWRPIAPRGYLEVGCVAWPDAEEPPLGLVRCMRRDLVSQSHVPEAPLWTGSSSQNQFWRCSLWPVDNPAHTFLAVKPSSDQRPNPQLARTPIY